MLVRLRGWGDDDILMLLTLLRRHLQYYVYASDSRFADIVRAGLPEKATAEILEMVRALMEQFGLRLSTKNFRTDVIVKNRQELYVYEHLYESIYQLPENKAGGVWLPDELSRFFQKAKQYRGQFTHSEEKYFQQVQLWGKSIAETKSKFYALREIFMTENRRLSQRSEVEEMRLKLLKDIFTNVPPKRLTEKKIVVASKKPQIWSSADMATLIDFVVRITTQIQTTGSSDLVKDVAVALNRSEGSCVNKLLDMKNKFLKRASTTRAANLPDSISDPNSEAYKIFSAGRVFEEDWADINDPYAFGFFALKSLSHRLSSIRSKQRKSKTTRTHLSQTRKATPTIHDTACTSSASSIPTISVVSKHSGITATAVTPSSSCKLLSASELPASQFDSFIQEMVGQCPWKETVLLHVIRCMQYSIGLYRSNKIVHFFSVVASATPGTKLITVNAKLCSVCDLNYGLNHRSWIQDSNFSSFLLTRSTFSLDISSNMTSGNKSSELLSDQGIKEQYLAAVNEGSEAKSAGNSQNDAANENSNRHSNNSNEDFVNNDTRADDYKFANSRVQQTFQTHNFCSAKRDYELLTATSRADYEEGAFNGDKQEESPIQAFQTGMEDGAHDPDSEKQSSLGLLKLFSCDQNLSEFNCLACVNFKILIMKLTLICTLMTLKNTQPALQITKVRFIRVRVFMRSMSHFHYLIGVLGSVSSNCNDARDCHVHVKGLPPLKSLHSKRVTCTDLREVFTRKKNEQPGKRLNLTKKRRLSGNVSTVDRDDLIYDEDEEHDESDNDPLRNNDNNPSDEEFKFSRHPLQGIIDSLQSHMVQLQQKQRVLIEQQEERDWQLP
ncbi:uncharacterized protein CCR75_001523 [Bremia lactucae]|uniref:Uncharacterized protein n=1 Tax=Bremia lactucae TaxID=4779 RepID=A0A976FEF7_BRELC|nr:hypothetical protein CCR75_001523 [Bremia lactucae]